MQVQGTERSKVEALGYEVIMTGFTLDKWNGTKVPSFLGLLLIGSEMVPGIELKFTQQGPDSTHVLQRSFGDSSKRSRVQDDPFSTCFRVL